MPVPIIDDSQAGSVPGPVINNATAGFGSQPQGPGMPTQRIVRNGRTARNSMTGVPFGRYPGSEAMTSPAVGPVGAGAFAGPTVPTGSNASADPYTPQQHEARQNWGLEQRDPSNPQYAYGHALSVLDSAGGGAPTIPGPSSATGAGAPVLSSGSSSAAPSSGATPSSQPQRYNAGNGVSDQIIRQMYKVAMDQNPGNLAGARQQFYGTAAKYGINGTQWEENQRAAPGAVQTQFVNGYKAGPAAPVVSAPIPSNTFGTNYSEPGATNGARTAKLPDGRVVMVDANGQQVGGTMAQQSPIPPTMTPEIGPAQGYTPVDPNAILGPTKNQPYYRPEGQTDQEAAVGQAKQQADQAGYTIRDDYQAPFGANARDQAVAPIVAPPPSPEKVAAAQALVNNTPPTAREKFNANVDLANQAVQQPRAGVAQRAGAVGAPREGDRVSFFKSLANERVDDGKGGTRRMTYHEKVQATNDFFSAEGAANAPASSAAPVQPAGQKLPPVSTYGAPIQPAPSVLRSGTLPDGRRVHQLADGRVVDERGVPVQ